MKKVLLVIAAIMMVCCAGPINQVGINSSTVTAEEETQVGAFIKWWVVEEQSLSKRVSKESKTDIVIDTKEISLMGNNTFAIMRTRANYGKRYIETYFIAIKKDGKWETIHAIYSEILEESEEEKQNGDKL